MPSFSAGNAFFTATVLRVDAIPRTLKMYEAGAVVVEYRDTTAATAATDSVTLDGFDFDLTQDYAEQIVASSVRFTLAGRTYVDRAGALVHSVNGSTGAAINGGSVNYALGTARVTGWPAGAANTVALQSLTTQTTSPNVNYITFRTPILPLRPQSLTIACTTEQGEQLSLTADADGVISHVKAEGVVDFEAGVVALSFGTETEVTGDNRPAIEAAAWYLPALEYTRDGKTYVRLPIWVVADTLRYSAVAYSYLPLSADILGLDPVRLPSDGRVPIFRVGDVVVVHDTAAAEFASPDAGDSLSVGRSRLASLRLVDSLGAAVPASMYSADLLAGTVTLNNTFALGLLTPPLYAEHRVEDMAVLTDVQINGLLRLNRPLTHNYTPASFISSALIAGDLQARVFGQFSQNSWGGVFSDSLIGSPASAQYNDALYPILTTNAGALAERWALIFISPTSYRVVGEHVGQIATGTINEVCAPLNPASNAPYFEIQPLGWGGGWAAGNALRLNTAAAHFPVWIARTVAAGQAEADDDRFSIQIRGDIDR